MLASSEIRLQPGDALLVVDVQADFLPSGRLAVPAAAHVVSKATRPETDAYSGFDGTDLDTQLRRIRIRRLLVGGLATDCCVLATVNDARHLGYDVVLFIDAVRAVDLRPGDSERAIAAMVAGGAIEAHDMPLVHA